MTQQRWQKSTQPDCRNLLVTITYFIFKGLVCYVISILGITAGAHRLWCHKSYKAKLPLKIVLMILNCMALQVCTVQYCQFIWLLKLFHVVRIPSFIGHGITEVITNTPKRTPILIILRGAFCFVTLAGWSFANILMLSRRENWSGQMICLTIQWLHSKIGNDNSVSVFSPVPTRMLIGYKAQILHLTLTGVATRGRKARCPPPPPPPQIFKNATS